MGCSGMDKQEFERLREVDVVERKLTIDDLADQSPRTLLYGYTCDRATWHVYIAEGEIRTVLYGGYNDTGVHDMTPDSDDGYVPDKRLYPECCDEEFCTLLIERGVHLPFTTFDEDREVKQYYGKVF